MKGPRPAGYWSANASEQSYRHLESGRTYEVAEDFLDHDRIPHRVGERWTFAGSSYVPEKNRILLFVQTSEGEWRIRLQLTEDEQLDVSRVLHMYLREV